MNNGKLCGLVVMLCVICPILVGYAWPVDSTSETAWETGDSKDISADAINAKLPVFVPYNDPFNNNQNVFEDNLYANVPAVFTGSPGPIWSTLNPELNTQSVSIPADGFYVINDVGTWQSWGTAVAVIFPMVDAWVEEIDMNDGGSVADLVVYYPKTDKMYFRHVGDNEFKPIESHRLSYSAGFGYEGTTQDLSYILYYDEGYYADLSAGMQVPWYTADWFNGYQNKGFDIIFSTTDNNSQVDLVILDPTIGYPTDTHIKIKVDSGTISMMVYDGGVPYYYEELGSNTIYDKVLLTVDYDTAGIVLSGLRGMDSYLGDYTAAIRESIKADWETPVIFYSFTIDRYAGSNAVWYVADTLSGVGEMDGSHNFRLDLRDYNAIGSCQLNIRSVTQHGSNLNFIINGSTKYGTITNGELSVSGVDGTITVPVNNLLVGLIDNKIYLNGYLLAEASSITEAELSFTGDWKMSLYYYPVTESTVPGYAWLPGGFGLDVTGFCSVGLITSCGSALGLGLYGKRSGVKVALVSLTALFCAAAYLIFMMGGIS